MSFWEWFWEFMLIFFVVVPLLMLWGFVFVDIFRRTDMEGWQKVLWMLAIFIFPYIGALIYLLVRPRSLTTGGYPYATYGGGQVPPPA